MTFRSFIRDGGVDKKGIDFGPKFCVGLIVSNGEQGVRQVGIASASYTSSNGEQPCAWRGSRIF